MTSDDWLQKSSRRLAAAGIESARLDCLILLEDATGKDRGWLLAHPEYELSDQILDELNKKCTQRETHTPLAYIRGRSEFYGRMFHVNQQVLEPRPETETIIELLKKLPLPAKPVVVDVGTGSGALAITAKLELPQATVLATDIDPACLEVAKQNAANLSANVTFIETNLIDNLPQTPDVVLANLPYVPDEFEINQAATHEPKLAIFGGPDGLNLYRTMFAQIAKLPTPPTFILAESLPSQHQQLTTIAKENGYDQQTVADFIQLFRLPIDR